MQQEIMKATKASGYCVLCCSHLLSLYTLESMVTNVQGKTPQQTKAYNYKITFLDY